MDNEATFKSLFEMQRKTSKVIRKPFSYHRLIIKHNAIKELNYILFLDSITLDFIIFKFPLCKHSIFFRVVCQRLSRLAETMESPEIEVVTVADYPIKFCHSPPLTVLIIEMSILWENFRNRFKSATLICTLSMNLKTEFE